MQRPCVLVNEPAEAITRCDAALAASWLVHLDAEGPRGSLHGGPPYLVRGIPGGIRTPDLLVRSQTRVVPQRPAASRSFLGRAGGFPARVPRRPAPSRADCSPRCSPGARGDRLPDRQGLSVRAPCLAPTTITCRGPAPQRRPRLTEGKKTSPPSATSPRLTIRTEDTSRAASSTPTAIPPLASQCGAHRDRGHRHRRRGGAH